VLLPYSVDQRSHKSLQIKGRDYRLQLNRSPVIGFMVPFKTASDGLHLADL
jgi:hypothetical protein